MTNTPRQMVFEVPPVFPDDAEELQCLWVLSELLNRIDSDAQRRVLEWGRERQQAAAKRQEAAQANKP